MAESLNKKIIASISEVNNLYHRLVLIVASSEGEINAALKEVGQKVQAPLFNVNLEISARLLDLTERARVLQVSRILEELVNEADSDVILLNNIEILFDVSLKQDPLRLLQKISRNKTIVAVWKGRIDNDLLIYAIPEHPEYRRYPVKDFLAICPEETQS